jgi:DnaJ family protein B protein 4
MSKKQNLYDILEISRDSDSDSIKKNYRKLALKYHPDRNKDPKSENHFKNISEAYSILSDPSKRRNYDLLGDSFFESSIQNDISPFKIFDQMFSGNSFMSENVFTMTGNIEDDIKNFTQSFINLKPLIIKIDFTLEQCFNGDKIKKNIEIKRKLYDKIQTIEEILEIDIPKGVTNQYRKTLRGKGNEDKSGKKGNILIIYNELPHDKYKRKGINLVYEKKILLNEALNGLEFVLKPIFGGHIILESYNNDVIDGDTIHILKKFGLPDITENSKIGDLYINYKIIFPKNLSDERKKLLLKILPRRSPLPDSTKQLIRKKLNICNDKEITIFNEKPKTKFKSMLDDIMKNPMNSAFSFGFGMDIGGNNPLENFNIGEETSSCIQS